LRKGEFIAARAEFTASHSAAHGLRVDPVLYLGGLNLRDGQPRDALRVLADANKLAPQCPLISWQLGTALMATGGDAMLAIRALERATGADGFPRFVAEPTRMWIETLPADSWVRNVARRAATQRARFQCPLGFDNPKALLAAARLTLADALVVCQRPSEAVMIFHDLLRSDDSLPIRRGLGFALVGMGKYDDALPHLQKAHALENPPQTRTLGTLAQCLANAKGDRVGNVQQALALIASQPVRSDAIWARHAGAVFAIAHGLGLPVKPAQISELADVLISSNAADRTAATVYDLLALRDPEAVPREAAWLYTRAAERDGVRVSHDDDLFNRAFSERAAMERFFEANDWDFAAVERLYLTRWADRHPGSYPSGPGPEYATQAESALLGDSLRLENQGQTKLAESVAQLALTLAPQSAAAHDRLAEFEFRRGQREAAIDWLKKWEKLYPTDPTPIARRALIEQARSGPREALLLIRQALELARGTARAPIALAAARIALAAGQTEQALAWIDDCLTFDAGNVVALSARAALLWESGAFGHLAKMTDSLAALPAEDPWLHYLVGVCALVALQDAVAEERARLCAGFPETAAEGQHLLALVQTRRGKHAEAFASLQRAQQSSGPTAEHARALRGQLAWRAGDFAEALRVWQPIVPARLKSWHLDALMPGATFVAGLRSMRDAVFEDAAKWFRAAARLGFNDARLDALLGAASRQASDKNNQTLAIGRLEQALESAGPRPVIVRYLARAYRLLGRTADAERVLDRVEKPDAPLLVERGLLALLAGQLAPAERAFDAAVGLDRDNGTAISNLILTRLSLGRLADAATLLPAAVERAPTAVLRRLAALLKQLLATPPTLEGTWTADDDAAVLDLLRKVGRLDAIEPLFDAWSKLRPQSPAVRVALTELQPLRAKQLLDRGDAAGLLRQFGPLAQGAPRALRNLLGVAAALRQDFTGAGRHFHAAAPADKPDARVEQNLAIIRGWEEQPDRAAHHWQRFLELHRGQTPIPKEFPDYHARIETLIEELLTKLDSGAPPVERERARRGSKTS
jgi:tetratricopeptide (TPR) repeat protein